MRFRLKRPAISIQAGLLAPVAGSQVTVLSGSDIANDDYFEVARNSVSVPLDVLANDFQLAGNSLIIDSLNTIGNFGIVP